VLLEPEQALQLVRVRVRALEPEQALLLVQEPVLELQALEQSRHRNLWLP
jgi:hypothetical protein